jgi:MoxR-like ATPase
MTGDEVRITIKEVYKTQQEQGVALHEISAKLDRLLDSHARVDERVQDHELRIRLLEQRVWALPSIATVIAVASLVWQMIK